MLLLVATEKHCGRSKCLRKSTQSRNIPIAVRHGGDSHRISLRGASPDREGRWSIWSVSAEDKQTTHPADRHQLTAEVIELRERNCGHLINLVFIPVLARSPQRSRGRFDRPGNS